MSQLNIFTDYHHSGLSYSFHLALEKRLGHSVFRPIGMEWFERGFWDIAKPYNNDLGTVKQYLSMRDGYVKEDSPPLNTIVGRNSLAPYYTVYDHYHDYNQKAITFQQFLDMDIDVIIATIPDHWYTYKRLRDQFKPKAKLICQMGNMFNELPRAIEDGTVENLMASTSPLFYKNSTKAPNVVYYYQEQPEITYTLPTKTMNISSYAHVMPKPELYEEYKRTLSQYTLKSYGAGCADGWMPTLTQLYETMRTDMYVYHVKPGGDGYGWNWHSAYMMGRPIITNFSDYKDKLGGALFVDGETGLNLEAHTVHENSELIKKWTDTDYFIEQSQKCRTHFTLLVNYENEAEKLRQFFENLR